MATAEQYAAWLVQNQSKKGTPEFDTVAAAYRSLRSEPVPEPVAPSKERTFGEAAKDIGAGVVGGIGSLVSLPGQLAGLVTGNMQDSTSMELGKDLQKYAQEMKSAGLKAREAERASKIAESAKQGQFQAFGTALSETVKDPGLLLTFLAEQAPQLLVPFGAARSVGAAARGLGATEAVAGKAAVSGAVGAGGVQQGADVGANAYENIYKELKSKGASDTEAAQGALTLARQAGAAAGTISLLAQRLPGARQLEEVLAGVPGKGAAGLGGRLRTAGGTAVGETVGEIPEEVGGKFVSNLAMQQVKPEQSLTEGLGEAAAMATIGGVGLGGAAGLARSPAAPEVAPPAAPQAPEQPPAQPALQQQIEAITGAAPREAAAPELLSSEEANRQRLQMLQQKADAEAKALEGTLPESPQAKAARAASTPAAQPSINEQMPTATPQAELEAKQAEIDRLRLEAGLPTGASSKTPGVQPEQVVPEETPTPKIVDNRPLEERAAKNRLLVMRNMLQNQGGDPESLTIVPHPTDAGKFAIQSLDVPTKFTKNLPETAINKPESTPIIDPVNAYIEIAKRTNTPASMRLVKDFEAGIVTREDIQAAIAAEQKAGQPLPLNYKGNGEPWFLSAEVSKPRGDRTLPVSATLTPTPEGPEIPPVTKPATQVYAEQEPPAAGTTGKPPVVEKPPVEAPTTPEVEPPTPTTEMPKTLGEFKARMPVASNNLEVRAANEQGNFALLAKTLAKSKNPAIRRIGELGRGVATKIKLRKPGNVGTNVAGVYRYADDSIQMAKAYAGDEHTNAHETLHGLISKAQRFPTERQKPIVEQIEKLYKHVKKELRRQGKDYYGLTNEREFTAEAMTNPEFQYELMQISYGGRRSAWTAFTRMVADLLGIQNVNALTEVMNLVDRLAQTKQPKGIKSDKGDVDYSEMTDQMEIPKSIGPIKQMVSGALQKQKPLAAETMQGVNPEFTAAANRVFKPQSRTIVEKITDMQDRFWQRLAQGIADQYRTIKDYSPIGYMQARLSKTVDGALEGILFSGHVFNDGGALNIKPNTKGLVETLKPVGSEVDRYQMWVALSREANLPEEKRSRSDDMDFMVANRKQLSEGTIDGKPRAEVYAAVLKDMNNLNRSVLDVALDQGLIDKFSYDNFVRDIYYIPFYRQMEDGDLQGAQTSAGLTRQQFSKALKGGGERPFGDLMENTLRNWSHILSASMKNQAAATTLKDALELDAVEPNLKSGMVWKNGKVANEKTGQLVGDGSLKSDYTEAGPDTVKVMEEGKPAYYTVKDPLLLESITSIGYMGPKSKFLDISRDFKNLLQYGVTMSPAFKVNNLFRDSVQAMAVSNLKKNPFANVIDGWVATDKNNPAHISALAGGAIFNFGTAYEGNQAKLIKRLLAKGVKEADILDTPDKIKAGLAKIFEKYEELGNKSEAANRMALYNQLREKGLSHLQASYEARDLMDFSMQGSWGAFRYLTQVVPFMNARIQGLYKLGRDGIVPTGRVLYNSATGKELDLDDKKKAQAFSIVSGAVCLASLALYYGFKDDEEFQKRDNWDRDNFWWIKLPGMDAAVRIPKPFEIGALGTIVERTAEQILDQDAEGKLFTDALTRMVFDTFAMNPLPQIFKPIVDLYSNKDSFSGSPIETAGMEALSKAERKTENTSPLALALAPVLNIALPEQAELSPVQVDYAIKGYFGWLGGTVATTSMYAVAPFKDGEYPDTKWMDKASLGFVKTLPANQSFYTTAFYENNKQIQQAFADMRHYSEIGEMDKVQEIFEEKGDKIALQKLYSQSSKQMANIRKQIQVVTADTSMDGTTKREQIDQMKELISMIAKQAEDTRKAMK
jgi:hypothetical protein